MSSRRREGPAPPGGEGSSESPPGHVSFQVSFLPREDPLTTLPAAFAAWDEAGSQLSRWLVAGRARDEIRRLPELDPDALRDGRELERAMMLLSFLGHAFLWGQGEGRRDAFPANLARPWAAVAARLGRPPVLSYASYALSNFRRFDRAAPRTLSNLALLQNFLGGQDEDWFILVHVAIEDAATPALSQLRAAQRAMSELDGAALLDALALVADAIEAMAGLLARMPERCDPYVYFHRVRPFIHGFRDHPALPDGVVFEGVERFDGRPQRFRGETGAQSSIVPALDAFLGVRHRADPLRVYLDEMREYMPPAHRRFLEAVERGPNVADHLRARPDARAAALADRCVEGLRGFRAQHLAFAEAYIHQQRSASDDNPATVGTGGTPFMRYLAKHRDETRRPR